MRELLFADTAAFQEMEEALHAAWLAWGYHRITLPAFEYADTLATDVGAQVSAEMYRFFDRSGRALALRPDLTIPTARVVGTRLYDQPMPLRLSYIGSVFRHEPPRAGRQHEFTQAGVELIGAVGSAADAEAIALAVAALRAVGLPDFKIVVGHVGFFRGLLAALALPERLAARVRQAVDRKAEAELRDLAASATYATPVPQSAGLRPTVSQSAGLRPGMAALLALPRLHGGAEILAEAARFCVTPAMTEALADLTAVAELLDAYGVAGSVDYDLAEIRDLGYYTGITFDGFAPGLGFDLISGGRYDNLIGHFGPPFPAVGWALTLDRVLVARERQGVKGSDPVADAIVSTEGKPARLAWILEARTRGLRVEVDPQARDLDALWVAAQGRRIARAVIQRDQDWLAVRDAAGQRLVAVDDWEEVARWRTR